MNHVLPQLTRQLAAGLLAALAACAAVQQQAAQSRR